MRISQITIGKEMKIGLPNYSNTTASCQITYDISEGESPDWDSAWDEINRQMFVNVRSIDPAWIKEKEYGNFFKLIIKVPKEKHGQG